MDRFVTRLITFSPTIKPFTRPQITEQEIKDGLAMTMKRPPSQEELAAVVRWDSAALSVQIRNVLRLTCDIRRVTCGM